MPSHLTSVRTSNLSKVMVSSTVSTLLGILLVGKENLVSSHWHPFLFGCDSLSRFDEKSIEPQRRRTPLVWWKAVDVCVGVHPHSLMFVLIYQLIALFAASCSAKSSFPLEDLKHC